MQQHNSILGAAYLAGHGISRDYAEALNWLQKAADQQLSTAYYAIGYMQEKGKGIPKNYSAAAMMYKKAADQGFAAAQGALRISIRGRQGCTEGFRPGDTMVP